MITKTCPMKYHDGRATSSLGNNPPTVFRQSRLAHREMHQVRLDVVLIEAHRKCSRRTAPAIVASSKRDCQAPSHQKAS